MEVNLISGEVLYPEVVSHRAFANGLWLMDLAKECNIDAIEQAAKEYLEVKDLMIDGTLSIRNKKRKLKRPHSIKP